MNINFDEITFIVQGPIAHGSDGGSTKFGLQTIRNHFPGSTIILSTWEGESVDGLDFDKACFSADPGPIPIYWLGEKVIDINVNRQIVSVGAGLALAATKYAVKMRSDMFWSSNNVLKFWGAYSQPEGDTRLLKRRVIVPTDHTQIPDTYLRCCFHVSDWFQFGLLEDLIEIWSVPLASAKDYWQHIDVIPNTLFINPTGRYTPEQYLFSNFVRKHISIKFNNYADYSHKNAWLTRKILADNYVVVDISAIGLNFPKYQGKRTSLHERHCFTFDIWLNDALNGVEGNRGFAVFITPSPWLAFYEFMRQSHYVWRPVRNLARRLRIFIKS